MEWYQEDPARYNAEMDVLKRRHPNVRIIFTKNKEIVVYKKVVSRKDYLFRIVVPRNFPYSQPKSYPEKPVIKHLGEKGHQFKDNSLCLFKPEEANPNISIAMIADWTVDWVRGYEIWLSTGEFPEKWRHK